MRHRGMLGFDLVEIPRGLHHKQRSRLREVRIEYFAELFSRIKIGKDGGADPDGDDGRQRQHQQPLF